MKLKLVLIIRSIRSYGLPGLGLVVCPTGPAFQAWRSPRRLAAWVPRIKPACCLTQGSQGLMNMAKRGCVFHQRAMPMHRSKKDSFSTCGPHGELFPPVQMSAGWLSEQQTCPRSPGTRLFQGPWALPPPLRWGKGNSRTSSMPSEQPWFKIPGPARSRHSQCSKRLATWRHGLVSAVFEYVLKRTW